MRLLLFTVFSLLYIRQMDEFELMQFAWTDGCGFIRCNCFQTWNEKSFWI